MAQSRLQHNKDISKRRTTHKYLLRRLLTCGECGARMQALACGGGKNRVYLYYSCPARYNPDFVQRCNQRSFRADRVDGVVWNWITGLLTDPEALRQGLEAEQTEREKKTQPLRDRLEVIDDLRTSHQAQLEKLLDLYLSGDFAKEVLTERKAQLEKTIAGLADERTELLAHLEARTLSDEQIASVEAFARELAPGLEAAKEDFDTRRRVVELLDVHVTLVEEQGRQVVYVRCLVKEAELWIESWTTRKPS
jgi:site-specific DNA recombinase